MRKDSFLTLTALALILTLGGCSKSDDPSTSDDGAIHFGVTSNSRATIEGTEFADDAQFAVWGWRTLTDEPSEPVNVFDKTVVTKVVTESGSTWGYDGKRYWVPGYTYNFHAVYPVFPAEEGQPTADVAPDGTITVIGFDCSATGDAAIDLMTSSSASIPCTEESTPGTVALQFSHELARLKFTVKVEDEVTATVTGAKLYGVVYQGDYSSANKPVWTLGTSYSETNTTFVYNPTNPQPLTTDGINVFPDILIIPDEDIEDAIFELTYYYDEYSQVPVTKKIKVKTTSIPGWTKGQSYSYTVTIGPNNIQFQPVVTPWNTSTGGIITVE